jgi:hypothetical protein
VQYDGVPDEKVDESRALPWPALPTHAFVVLILRLGWASYALKESASRDTVREYASALAKCMSAGEWFVVLTFERGDWTPPSSWADQDSVWLLCVDNTIDFSGLRKFLGSPEWPQSRRTNLRRVLDEVGVALRDHMPFRRSACGLRHLHAWRQDGETVLRTYVFPLDHTQ